MSDRIKQALQDLHGELPQPRLLLSEDEKDELVARVGPRTARNIVQAKSEQPLRRIPFLFSSVDTQAVVDLLANDMEQAIKRALEKKLPKGARHS